jgi:hypothetical protein
MSAIIQAASLFAAKVFGAQYPSAGPQCVPVSQDFSLSSAYTLNYSNQSNIGRLQLCQTIFIDASNVDNPVSVSFDGSGQTITVKGRTQGYYPVLASNPLNLSISCPGLVGGAPAIITVQLMNFPVAAAWWLTQ